MKRLRWVSRPRRGCRVLEYLLRTWMVMAIGQKSPSTGELEDGQSVVLPCSSPGKGAYTSSLYHIFFLCPCTPPRPVVGDRFCCGTIIDILVQGAVDYTAMLRRPAYNMCSRRTLLLHRVVLRGSTSRKSVRPNKEMSTW